MAVFTALTLMSKETGVTLPLLCIAWDALVYSRVTIRDLFHLMQETEQRDLAARKLFLASIYYLPALLFPLVLDLWLL